MSSKWYNLNEFLDFASSNLLVMKMNTKHIVLIYWIP
jgi:hypothetical protein